MRKDEFPIIDKYAGKSINEVLDKIRAEIEEHAYPVRYDYNSIEKGMTLTGINQVIDKYRKEG